MILATSTDAERCPINMGTNNARNTWATENERSTWSDNEKTTWTDAESESEFPQDRRLATFSNDDVETTRGKCCKIKKIPQGVISFALFATSIYFGTQALIDRTDPRIFCAWALLNGPSTAILFYTTVPKKIARKVRDFFLRWSYEIQFIAAQFDMNFAAASTRKYTAAGFVWAGSLLAAGDFYHIWKRRRADSTASSEPAPLGTKLIPTLTLESWLAMDKRDPYSKITFSALNIFRALAVEGCFWALQNRYSNYDDFSRVGAYGGLAHYYAGSEIGEAFTRIVDDVRENSQRTFRAKQLTNTEEKPPIHLKVLNWFRNDFLSQGPYFSSWLLPFLIKPSTPGELSELEVAGIGCAIMLLFGAMQGSLGFVERKEFENPDAKEHKIRKIKKEKEYLEESSINAQTKSCFSSCRPVWHSVSKNLPISQYFKDLIYKYALSVLALIGLDAYMGTIFSTVIGTDSIVQIGLPILTLLFFSHCAFGLASFMREKYKPEPSSNRFLNEIYFRISRPTLGAMDYQFLRVHFRLDDEQLKAKSKQLFLGAVLAWIVWGFVYGCHLSKYALESPGLTSGMTGVELGLVSAQSFKTRPNVTTS
ncbi:MAG: hypothetical protein H0T62_06735 [Parachlamydiaceae bacterium]|nr:hypothetical protein [Parachlamydiaceae bacterium]